MMFENIINFAFGDRVRRLNRGGRGTVTHIVGESIYVHWDGKASPVLGYAKPCSASSLKRMTELGWIYRLQFEPEQENQFNRSCQTETFSEQQMDASLRHLHIYELSSEQLHNSATKWKIWSSVTIKAANEESCDSYVLFRVRTGVYIYIANPSDVNIFVFCPFVTLQASK